MLKEISQTQKDKYCVFFSYMESTCVCFERISIELVLFLP